MAEDNEKLEWQVCPYCYCIPEQRKDCPVCDGDGEFLVDITWYYEYLEEIKPIRVAA